MMESTNYEGGGCNNMSTVSNDIVLNISSYLGSRDLVSLALTCRRFGIVEEGTEDLVNKAAQHIINSKWISDVERHQLTKYNVELWIELYCQLEVLRSPLIFGELFGPDIEYVTTNYLCKSHLRIVSSSKSTAISSQSMRSGKHHVTFVCTGDMIGASLGIIRPKLLNWKNLVCKKTDRWGDSDIHYCAMLSQGVRNSFHYRNEKGIGHSFGADWEGVPKRTIR